MELRIINYRKLISNIFFISIICPIELILFDNALLIRSVSFQDKLSFIKLRIKKFKNQF